jgi:hypothetical protein
MRISRILQLLALAAAMNVPMATQNRAITNIREKKVANSSGFRLSLLPKKSQVKVHEPIDIDFLIRNEATQTNRDEKDFVLGRDLSGKRVRDCRKKFARRTCEAYRKRGNTSE